MEGPMFMEPRIEMLISVYILNIGSFYLIYPILGIFAGYINNLK